jgi:hypothetical protein
MKLYAMCLRRDTWLTYSLLTTGFRESRLETVLEGSRLSYFTSSSTILTRFVAISAARVDLKE